eukprot:scaffold26403_cov21-Prasinocladus_malaysianus.AAC.1
MQCNAILQWKEMWEYEWTMYNATPPLFDHSQDVLVVVFILLSMSRVSIWYRMVPTTNCQLHECDQIITYQAGPLHPKTLERIESRTRTG